MIDLRRLLWVSRHVGGARGQRVCDQPGCGSPTEEQKPYCVDHLELNPYASEVLGKIRERAAQDERTRLGGHPAAELEAITATEILLYLKHAGERTFLRICRDLCLDKPTAWSYVTKLHIFCRIARTRDDRGVWRIRIRQTYLLELEIERYAQPAGPWRVPEPEEVAAS